MNGPIELQQAAQSVRGRVACWQLVSLFLCCGSTSAFGHCVWCLRVTGITVREAADFISARIKALINGERPKKTSMMKTKIFMAQSAMTSKTLKEDVSAHGLKDYPTR